ncbi:DUF4044 domain-containing protein [Streptococcaceae bacterium ESL0729]|nr:DUF4044 domain-containing protein [Streptococcaceae bacterium ESL0729]
MAYQERSKGKTPFQKMVIAVAWIMLILTLAGALGAALSAIL